MFLQIKDLETHQILKVWVNSPNESVANLQQSLEKITGIEQKYQQLISHGKRLSATETLASYGIAENSLIYFCPTPNLSETIVLELRALTKEFNLGFKIRFSLKDPISLVRKLTEERIPSLQASKWVLYHKGRILIETSSSGKPMTLFDYGIEDRDILYFCTSLNLNKELVSRLSEERRQELEVQVLEEMVKEIGISKSTAPSESPVKRARKDNNSFAGLKPGFLLTRKEAEKKKALPKSAAMKKQPLVQENKRICWKCSKKIALLSSELNRCKCNFVFCDVHRLPENHDCTFDWKGDSKNILQKSLVPIVAEKIQSM